MTIETCAIVGRGCVGLLYGNLIARNLGQSAVRFVMDEARFERHLGEVPTINGEPCTIETIPASRATPSDLVIVATKATALDGALDVMAPLVGPDTIIVSLLNGVTSEGRIANRFGWDHLVASVAQGMDSVYVDGRLTYAHPGSIHFGAMPGTAAGVVDDLDDFLGRAGIEHVVEADIRHRLWTKLMLNVGINQTCMVYGGTYASASERGSEQYRCFIAAMREARVVACAEGVEVTEDDLAAMADLVATLDSQGMPSMAQDRVSRRHTEVEEFAGTIIRLARKHSIPVPQNEWLYQRIIEIEQSYA